MTKTRTIVALGMAALLSFTMSAAATVFPGDSTPKMFLSVNGGSEGGRDGYIPIVYDVSYGDDIGLAPTQDAVCKVPDGEDMPATLADGKAGFGPLTYVEQKLAEFGADPDAINILGPVPDEYAEYTLVYADKNTIIDYALMSVYAYAYDKDGCAVTKFEMVPAFVLAVIEPGDQHYSGPAWYEEPAAPRSNDVAVKPAK